MQIDVNTLWAVGGFFLASILLPIIIAVVKAAGGRTVRDAAAMLALVNENKVSNVNTTNNLQQQINNLKNTVDEQHQRQNDVLRAVEVKIADALRYIEVKIAEGYVSMPRFERFENTFMNSITELHRKIDVLTAAKNESDA